MGAVYHTRKKSTSFHTENTGKGNVEKSRHGPSRRFGARSVLSVRGHGKKATESVRATTAKPENPAGLSVVALAKVGGFFNIPQCVTYADRSMGRYHKKIVMNNFCELSY